TFCSDMVRGLSQNPFRILATLA
ncbi:Uncharacterised protein, partial [uncultured Comamonas sp.]